ncbi:MAG: hypothetical protein ACR2GY_03485 [Phycisphaerales bacterium]
MAAGAAAFILLLALAGVGSAGSRDCVTHDNDDHDADRLPRDVSVFINIRDVSALERRLGGSTLGDALRNTIAGSEIGKSWESFARTVRMDDAELIQLMFSGSCTLAMRPQEQDADAAHDWLVMTHMTDNSWSELAHHARFRVHRPLHSVPVRALPDQQLRFAHVNDRLLFAPLDADDTISLFGDSLAMLRSKHAESLTDSPGWRDLARLRDADVHVLIRHQPPTEGFSVAAVTFDESGLRIEHRSRLSRTAVGDPPRPITFACDRLPQIRGDGIAAIVHPRTTPSGQLATFFRAQMPADSLPRSLTARTGERMVWRVSAPAAAGDPLQVTLSIEATSLDGAAEDLDRFMTGVVSMLHTLARQPAPAADVHRFEKLAQDACRSMDVGKSLAIIFPDHASLARMPLCWRIVETETFGDDVSRGWMLIGTSVEHVNGSADVLRRALDGAEHSVQVSGLAASIDAPQAAAIASLLAEKLNDAEDEASDAASLMSMAAGLLRAAGEIAVSLEMPARGRIHSTWLISLQPAEAPNVENGRMAGPGD